jgi:methyl-accepting chemotaxis protein
MLKHFHQMKVGGKLSLLLAVFVVGFAVFAGTAYSTLVALRVNGELYQRIAQTLDIRADILPPPEYIIESYLITHRIDGEKDRSRIEGYVRKLRSLRNEYDTRHAYWVKSLPDEERALKDTLVVKSYQPANDFYRVVESQFVPAALKGDHPSTTRLVRGELARLYEEHRAAIDEVVKMAEDRKLKDEATAEQMIGGRTLALSVVAVVVLALGSILSWYIARAIAEPLRKTVGMISSFSTEFSSTVEEQERMAAQQAAAVSQTTATMEELGASSRMSAEQADQASAGARQAMTLATEGIQTVDQTLAGMESLKQRAEAIAEQILRLSEQTSQIGNITNLVSDLANQTNMLALNAAVEAARAGEHGRGFAVVAAEIRKLADESKKSAERINALVAEIRQATNSTVMVAEEGTKTVQQGTRLAEKTGEAFHELAAAIGSAFESTQQITLNARQQASAVHQVVEAMTSLNAGARETAAGISQTRAGTRKLNEAARDLAALA